MKWSRKFYYKAAGGAMLAGCMLCVLAWITAGFDIHNLSNSTPYVKKEYSKKLDHIDTIQIDTEYDEIQILPSEDSMIHLSYYENEKTSYVIEDSTSTFRMQKKQDIPFYERLLSINTDLNSKSITIKVPASYQKQLLVDTTHGAVILQDVKKLADVTLITTYNTIDVKNIQQVNELSLNNTHGDISLHQIKTADRISMDTSYGAIDIDEVNTAKDFAVTTSHNDINLKNTSIKGELNASTTYGSIQIVKSSAADTNLESTHGAVKLHDAYETASFSANTTYDDITFNELKADTITLVTSHGAIAGSILGEQKDYHIKTDIHNGNTNIFDAEGSTNRSLLVKTSYEDCKIHFIPIHK